MTAKPQPASASAQESEASTEGSPSQGSGICSCANPNRTAETCSGHGSPESRSGTTYEPWVSNQRRELRTMDVSPSLTEPGGFTQSPFLLSSPAAPPARTSASPGDEPASPENDPGSSTSSPGSLTLFDPSGFSGRTFPVRSLHTVVGTSESCLERWPTSGTAWHGGFSTAVTSECRSDDAGCSSSEPSLTEILEPPQNVPGKYSLSARAARGILRRAEKRGKNLPPHLGSRAHRRWPRTAPRSPPRQTLDNDTYVTVPTIQGRGLGRRDDELASRRRWRRSQRRQRRLEASGPKKP